MRLAQRLSALKGQPLRYATASATTTLTYFTLTLLLAGPAGLSIQVAIPVGYTLSLVVHFSMQRYFVFRNPQGFALAMHHQVGRYVTAAAIQYGLTALITATIPDAIGVDERIVYLVTALTLALVTFLCLRFLVFHGPAEHAR